MSNHNTNIIAQIVGGGLDDMLVSIISAATQRQRKQAGNASLSLRVGDRAVLCGDKLRPRYLVGLEVTVHKVKEDTISVNFDEDDLTARRFAGVRSVRVPRNCIVPSTSDLARRQA
jgi:preprotein translocase subunit YajC